MAMLQVKGWRWRNSMPESVLGKVSEKPIANINKFYNTNIVKVVGLAYSAPGFDKPYRFIHSI
ncbi:hypothetical protein C2U68_00650 [Methylomonas koyamae]|nr:hypothetical protein C2U68_00650 [Methylomonas koyamae]